MRVGFGDSAYAEMTVETILRHEAGLPPFEEDEEFEVLPPLPDDPVADRRAFGEFVVTMDPINEPGTEFAYSNAGYGIASAARTVPSRPIPSGTFTRRPVGQAWAGV